MPGSGLPNLPIAAAVVMAFYSPDPAMGQLLQQTYGNNVVTQQVFEATTGRLKNIYAGAGNDRLYGSTGYWFGGMADGNDWLFGDEGADTFFATSEAQGGVDVIQDFDSTEGDLIALARYGENAEIAAINGMGGGWSNATHSLVDRGDITADGANVQAAMAAEFNAAGSSTTVYRFDYGGKSYLYWDAYGNDYSMGSGDDVVVEITGAVNLSAEHIYLYLEP